MKKIFYVASALMVALTSCNEVLNESGLTTPAEHTLMTKLVGGSEGDILEGSLLIKLDSEAVAKIEEGRFAEISGKLFEDLEPVSFSYAIPARPKNIEAARKYGLHQWFNVKFDDKTTSLKAAETLAKVPFVKSVQFSRHIEPVVAEEAMPFDPVLTKAAEEPIPVEEEGFNDPYNWIQWNLSSNKGSLTNGISADISVKDAWKLTAGDPSVIVAIFDCAVATRHEDLADAVWRNEKEINGTEDVDDDGNGFIDDKYGFNFVKCYTISPEGVEGMLDGKGQPAVDSQPINSNNGIGHGTHVAGIIGAVNNNGKGISSIAGGTGNGDGVRLMTCQIFDGNSSATDAQSAAAFIYAADNGACIAQCSYGTQYMITDDDTYINGGTVDYNGAQTKVDGSPLETAALLYFLDPSNSNHESLKGNIAVFAAGNHSNPYSIYPGALPYVISVTAFNKFWQPGGYTNYGPGCNISAPGGEWEGTPGLYNGMILSTGLKCSVDGGYPGVETDRGTSTNYVYMQGTSMACPHVSGVIALGIAYAKKLGKTFTREELTSLLLSSVYDYERYYGGTRQFYPPFSSQPTTINMDMYKGKMGTGAVDAWKFLMAIEGTPSVLVQAGTKAKINLEDYCNPNGSYTIGINDTARTALGLTSDPVIRNGYLEIECTKVGSGKIVISSSVGKDPQKEDGIGGMDYSREISIVSRPFASSNGGWL